MGFSWGAQVSLLTSSGELARRHSDRNLRFAAHLPLYPQCWVILTARNGKDKFLKPALFKQVTGSPAHILAGDKDDYDDPDGCLKFVASLPGNARPHFSVTVYKGATFAWDSRFSSAPYEAGANKGKGGIVNTIANAEIARASQAFAVSYFKKYLAAD
jgi:dienelactone hydrolase